MPLYLKKYLLSNLYTESTTGDTVRNEIVPSRHCLMKARHAPDDQLNLSLPESRGILSLAPTLQHAHVWLNTGLLILDPGQVTNLATIDLLKNLLMDSMILFLRTQKRFIGNLWILLLTLLVPYYFLTLFSVYIWPRIFDNIMRKITQFQGQRSLLSDKGIEAFTKITTSEYIIHEKG